MLSFNFNSIILFLEEIYSYGDEVVLRLTPLYEMKIKGLVPIIAHPERCECFRIHYDRIKEAVDEAYKDNKRFKGMSIATWVISAINTILIILIGLL